MRKFEITSPKCLKVKLVKDKTVLGSLMPTKKNFRNKNNWRFSTNKDMIFNGTSNQESFALYLTHFSSRHTQNYHEQTNMF